MAKVKNKRNAGLADRVHKKKKADILKKKVNPFEVHVNREKIQVLGKKSKHDKGLPGVSRAKAIQKRKETLGTEMKLMNKTNTFIDRRIGEKNNQLSAEDRMIARFAAERARQHNRKNIYNLADDEILTHRGQTLEQIEKFDDPRSDDDEEDGKGFGGLDDEFVSEGHFGGGVLSKTDSKDGAKSHKDLIEQLIAESKKRKAEKQKEKEQTLDLTEKLDSEWKDLQPVVFKKARVEESDSAIDKLLDKAEKNNQDYDKMMRELKFEKRGTPSDGLKSDEKKAQEEKEKLEQWEKERLQRMMGDEETVVKPKETTAKHRSAEDLEDNFELDNDQEFMLAYDKDGKPLVPEHILKDYSVPNAKPKLNDGVSDTSSDEDEESEDSDDSDQETENSNKSEDKKVENSKKTEEKSILFQNSESDNSSDNDSENIGADKYSEDKGNPIQSIKDFKKSQNNSKHLQNGDNSSDDSENDDNKQINGEQVKAIQNARIEKKSLNDNTKEITNKKGTKSNNKVENESKNKSDDFSEHSDDESVKDDGNDDFKDLRGSEDESDEAEVQMDKFTSFFDLKLSEGENLKELLSGKTPSEQASALKKLIKSYDPSLSENNKENLSRLFAHLLQYINDIFTNLTDEGSIMKAFLIFDRIVPYIFDLAITNKVSTKKFIVDLLKEKYELYNKRPKVIPDLDTLIFFKLISLLYPTSDFRHPVTTPAMIFMSDILTRSKFNNSYSISRGIFVVSLILEYTVLSKRLVPSALNFLLGLLYLASNTSILNPIQVVPPFKLHSDAKILNLHNDCAKMDVGRKMTVKDLASRTIDDDYKIRCLLTTVYMLKEFFDYFKDLEAQECLFEGHLKLLKRIDVDLYPRKVAKVVKDVSQYMKESLEVKTYTPLCREKQRPKALRLYEPDVQEVFTGGKSSKLSREQAESARLKTKYKREMKGAMREVRKDKAYVASVKIRQKIQSDNMRKDKVKQIYKEAALQQGELNKLKRMK